METDKGTKISEQYAIDIIADHSNHVMHLMLTAILTLCAIVIACVCVIVAQHKTYVALLEEIETTETYKLEVDQDADDNSDNYFVGRDLYGWQTESDGHSDENPNP